MEWIERLNTLQEKIQGLINTSAGLKEDNDSLILKNAGLEDEINKLNYELKHLKEVLEAYTAERDAVKDRVERLIEMID